MKFNDIVDFGYELHSNYSNPEVFVENEHGERFAIDGITESTTPHGVIIVFIPSTTPED